MIDNIELVEKVSCELDVKLNFTTSFLFTENTTYFQMINYKSKTKLGKELWRLKLIYMTAVGLSEKEILEFYK